MEFKVFWRSLRYWISKPQLDIRQLWTWNYIGLQLKKVNYLKIPHPSNCSYDWWLEDTGFRSCRTHQRGNRVFLFFLSTRYFSFSENKISRSNTPLIMLSVRETFQKDGFLFPLPATKSALPLVLFQRFWTWEPEEGFSLKSRVRTEFSLLILWILYLTLHCWVIC